MEQSCTLLRRLRAVQTMPKRMVSIVFFLSICACARQEPMALISCVARQDGIETRIDLTNYGASTFSFHGGFGRTAYHYTLKIEGLFNQGRAGADQVLVANAPYGTRRTRARSGEIAIDPIEHRLRVELEGTPELSSLRGNYNILWSEREPCKRN